MEDEVKCRRCSQYPCRCTDSRDVIAEHYAAIEARRLRIVPRVILGVGVALVIVVWVILL